MTKPLVDSLTLAVMRAFDVGIDVATEFAEKFADENPLLAEVRSAKPVAPLGQRIAEALDAVVVAPADSERAQVLHVPVVGPDGLTDRQRRGLGTVGLCPNCQQPNNNHAPACARASGEDPKAITKNAIPPLA